MHLLRKPLVIIGVVLSAGIAVLMYATSEDMKVSLALIAGLSALIVTLQLELILASVAADVWRRAQAVPWLDKALIQLVEDSYHLHRDESAEGALYVHAARNGLQRYVSGLAELRAGRYRLQFLDIDCLIEAAGRSTKHLRAVSLSSERDFFWNSDPGRRYYDANLKALRSGAIVERVFVYNDATASAVLEIAKKQAADRVDTWTVHEAQLTPEQRIDLAIFDDRMAYRANASQGREIDSQVLERREAEIEMLNTTFRIIRAVATRVQ